MLLILSKESYKIDDAKEWLRNLQSGEKIDRGFQLSYLKLSYRRKFIRTVWMMLFCIVVLLAIFISGAGFKMFQRPLAWGLVLAVLSSPIQLIYNYKKWKEEEHG